MFLAIKHGWPGWLARVIGTADFINHAIPTEDEVAGGVERLSAAGLVELRRRRLRLTRAGRRLYREMKGGSWFDEWHRLEGALPEAVDRAEDGQRLPAGAYERAVARYLARY